MVLTKPPWITGRDLALTLQEYVVCSIEDTDISCSDVLINTPLLILENCLCIPYLPLMTIKMIRRIVIHPKRVGVRYDNMKFSRILEPGIYWIFLFLKKVHIQEIFVGKSVEVVSNQTIRTSENLEIKLSYFVEFSIDNPLKYIDTYDMFSPQVTDLVKQDIHLQSQIVLRDVVSQMKLSQILDSRSKISEELATNLSEIFKSKGINIELAMLRDIGMKSDLRNIYTEEYMVEKKANLALASARSQVASARAMANASKIITDNKNIKFLKLLETSEKISQKTGNSLHVQIDTSKET